jgi:hypothetical protein
MMHLLETLVQYGTARVFGRVRSRFERETEVKIKTIVLALAALSAVPATAASPSEPGGPAPQGMVHAGDHRGPGGPGGPGGMPSPERMFAMMDANHDGVISRGEFLEAHRRMMERHGDGGERHGPPPGDRGAPPARDWQP